MDALEREIEAMDRGQQMAQTRNRNPVAFDALRSALNDSSCALYRLNKVRNGSGRDAEAKPPQVHALRFRYIRPILSAIDRVNV